MYVCMHLCMYHYCMYVYLYICFHTHMYSYIYTYIHIYIYIYTCVCLWIFCRKLVTPPRNNFSWILATPRHCSTMPFRELAMTAWSSGNALSHREPAVYLGHVDHAQFVAFCPWSPESVSPTHQECCWSCSSACAGQDSL